MLYRFVRDIFKLSCVNKLHPKMSAMPQAAFMTKKWTENQKRTPKEEIAFWDGNVELQPLHYNSKLMNSIWGLYNRYSVHNLKGSWDKELSFGAINQKLKSVDCAPNGTNVALTPWNQFLGHK